MLGNKEGKITEKKDWVKGNRLLDFFSWELLPNIIIQKDRFDRIDFILTKNIQQIYDIHIIFTKSNK